MPKKNQTVLPAAGGGSSVLPKLLGTLLLLGALVVVVKHPADAATWVQTLGTWVGGAADGVAAFFQQLAG
ncbi:hypothetical protein [Saccharomonospora halophila]|uniref:hypothetical protein n=1 Tax=Saccharomonospora halophila TaxID=129922 RepID=UPI0003796472|nr:hypothetical protein [Saccharomonospora halophila]